MPKLRSRDGVWYADCYFTDERGERHRRERSTHVRDDGTKQAERTAEAAGRNCEAALQAGKGRRAGATTLRSAYAARLKALELAGRAQETKDITLEKSVHAIRFFGGDRDVTTISEDELKAYGTKAREKRAAASVIREFTELRAACKAIGVTLPPPPDVGKPGVGERWINTEQTQALLERAKPRRRGVNDYRPNIRAYRYLGPSWSELYKIREQDVNRESWVVFVGGTKTEYRRRIVPVVEHVRDVFEPSFRFPMWSYGNGNNDLSRWARDVGIVGDGERFSFNDLRRSFATELVLAGVSTFHVAKLLGHKDSKMVELIYARVAAGAHMHSAVALLKPPSQS